MLFHEVEYVESRGTDREDHESITVLGVPSEYTDGWYVINAHRSEPYRFEVSPGEELDAMIQALQWAKDHPLSKPGKKAEPLAQYVEVVRPGDGGAIRADDPHPQEEDG